MPEYDDKMQATEDEIALIQPIIDQIKNGDTKEALDAIKALDKTIIDKIVLTKPFKNSNSILTAALESDADADALKIIEELIEKKCNLLAIDRINESKQKLMDDALSFWFKRIGVFGIANDSTNLFGIGQTLLKASNKTLFDQTFFQLIQWVRPKDLPVILYRLLGAEKFVQFLFHAKDKDEYLKHIIRKGRVPAFRECLEILKTENEINITQDILFKFLLNALAELTHPGDNFYETICEYSEVLHKNMHPTETKSLSEGQHKVLLETQITSPMDAFPDTEYWRLFVDGKKQTILLERGWLGYENREPGCLQKMYDAFIYAREDLETSPLTYEITDQIHRIATGHFEKGVPKNFRNSSSVLSGLTNRLPAVMTGSTDGSLTYQGFLEITKEPYSNWYRLKREADSNPANFIAVFSDTNCKNEAEAINTIKKIIEEYHENFAVAMQANDRTKQLQCIIKLASDYARFHPYIDGNNRTAVCILNRELQKHGFPLAILHDPNQLEGHSQAELFEKVCQGMQNFLTVKNQKLYPNCKFNTDLFTLANGAKPPPIQSTKSGARIKPG